MSLQDCRQRSPSGRNQQLQRYVSLVTSWQARPIAAAIIAAGIWFMGARWYVSCEQTVYYWDFIGWWERSVILCVWFSQAPWLACKAVMDSIHTSDYNLLAALPIAGWIALGDQSRGWFVMGLMAVYGTLSAAAFALLCSSFPARLGISDSAVSSQPGVGSLVRMPLCVAVIPSIVWVTWTLPFIVAVRGFVDLGACGITFFIWWLYLRFRPDAWNLIRAVEIGVLLAILFLFRRYWAFWITAFGVVAVCDAATTAIQLRARRVGEWYKPMAAPAFIGASALLVLLTLAFPLIARTIATPYGDIYSAYQKGAELGAFARTASDLLETIRENGLVTTVLGLFSLAYLCLRPDTRRIGILLAAQAVLCYLQFRRVQAPGLQHYLLWCTGLITATGLCASMIAYRAVNATRWLVAAALLAGGILQAAAAFTPNGQSIRILMAGNDSQLPLVRRDIKELERMISDIDQVVRETGAKSIYCLASSPILNLTTLVGYSPSLGKPFHSAGLLCRTADVDKRDGFPRDLLVADIVIVTDPPQTHLDPADQQVIMVPARQFLTNTGIAAAFDQIAASYELDNGTKAFLYRRSRDLHIEDVLRLCDELKKHYPTREYIYDYNFRGQ